MEILRRTPWSRIREQKQRVQRILGDCWQWETNGQCVKGINCSFRHDVNKRGKSSPSKSVSEFFHASRMSENHREPEVPEARVPVLECLDGLARITLKELAITHFVKNGTLQNASSTRPRAVVGSGKSALMRIARLMNSLAKGPKNGDKSAEAMLKKNERHQRTGRPVLDAYSSNTLQFGCVFQDMEPPKSSSILRKSSSIRKPIRRVKFTKAVVRHADIRDQNPSLGMICPGDLHQRNPNAPKFEDRSQEETEWQERCAREAAWRLAKNLLKLE